MVVKAFYHGDVVTAVTWDPEPPDTRRGLVEGVAQGGANPHLFRTGWPGARAALGLKCDRTLRQCEITHEFVLRCANQSSMGSRLNRTPPLMHVRHC